MEEIIPLDSMRWREQLPVLYPNDGLDISVLARRYLNDILERSSSPVAVIVWKPSITDLDWACVLYEVKKMKSNGASKLEITQFLGEQVKDVGHASMLWRGPNHEIEYASFRPHALAANGEASGTFRTFVEDINLEEKLPDVVLANLSASSTALFRLREIQDWDLCALHEDFCRLKENPPVFDLKSRKGAMSCSSLVMHLISNSCKTGNTISNLRRMVSEFPLSWKKTQNWKDGIGSCFFHAFIGALGSPIFALIDGIHQISSVAGDLELYFRTHSVNPNMVYESFQAGSTVLGPSVSLCIERREIRVQFTGLEVSKINEKPEVYPREWTGE